MLVPGRAAPVGAAAAGASLAFGAGAPGRAVARAVGPAVPLGRLASAPGAVSLRATVTGPAAVLVGAAVTVEGGAGSSGTPDSRRTGVASRSPGSAVETGAAGVTEDGVVSPSDAGPSTGGSYST